VQTLTCALLIPHHHEPCLLAHVDDGVWRLPAVTLHAAHWGLDTQLLRAALRAELGLDATVLRRMHLASDDAANTALAVYDLEIHDAAWQPAAGAWLSAADLAALAPADERMGRMVTSRLAELATGNIPPLRAPWARNGWYAQVVSWAGEQLERLGRPIDGAPIQHQMSGISCVLRIPTTAGTVFFKQAAALPLFCDEPRLLEWLAARAPDLAPAPLASEPARRWMLLDDLGMPLWDGAPDDAWLAMTRRHARLQRALVGQGTALFAAGCIDRRLERLPEHLAVVLADERVALGEHRQRLAGRLPAICAAVAELTQIGPPQTLVHADLHGGNVINNAGRLAVIDWTDACVSHPFFDLFTLLEHPATPETLRPALQEAYLAEWRDMLDDASFARAWQLVQPLAAFTLAVSYHGIITGIEPVEHPLFADDLPAFLGRGLDLLEAGEGEPSPETPSQ
jgi:hypothetical protein